MSKSDRETAPAKKAVALRYGENDAAPVIVASGMGYMAEKIVETAADCGVPIYEDTSLSTILTQLELGQEIPESLYQAIVEIYVYFLHFDLEKNGKGSTPPKAGAAAAENTPPKTGTEAAENAQSKENTEEEDSHVR